MHTPSLDRPIVILGAARSGTTLTGEILEHHPDVAYWLEPKYIWRYGRPWAPDDIREADEATPRVRRYIRKRFSRYEMREGKSRFMEKTPSNCFRVPFIHAVLPDVRFLHIIRDGRDVTRSAVKKWSGKHDPEALLRRVTKVEFPLREVPFYATAAFRDVVLKQFRPPKVLIRGPHFKGMRRVCAEQGVEVACALQWRESVRLSLEGLRDVPADQQLEVRFENLVADPGPVFTSILDFLELPYNQAIIDRACGIADVKVAKRWKHHASDPAIESHMQPLLSELGYD